MTPAEPAATASSRLEVVGAFALDVAMVMIFIAVGRATHGEGPWGIVITAWPFLAGLVVGWIVARAWRGPRIIRWTSIIIWLSTVGVGMLLRFVSGASVESAFIFVSVIALGAFLLGWRGAAWILSVIFARDDRRPPREEATGRSTTPKSRPDRSRVTKP